MRDDSRHDPPAPIRGGFPTTQWSIVLHAGAGSESQAHAALETLCRQYWYPLYGFVRRNGRAHHEAEDCTQEFLARLLANDGVARARPERGRFRAFLLTALRHFLINDWQRSHTTKRGGGVAPISLELRGADERFLHEPIDSRSTPEQAFDRNWALALVDRVLDEMRVDYETTGRGALFAALAPLIWDDKSSASPAQHAQPLGMNAHAFSVALQRLRRRFAERLRAHVTETVADKSDLDAELRHLLAALRDTSHG